ncbi:uncharacterized protein LOC144885855 [Branchiostoma floridae x Branchiostoma japonicum]
MAANSSSDWSDEETALLISIWGDQKTQEKLGRYCGKQEVVFKQISKAMREGGFDKTAAQCQSETEALLTKYHDVLDHNHRSGGRDCITMPFFSELDEFLRHRPASRPRFVIESMGPPPQDDSDSGDTDSDDNTNSSSGWSDEETALLISIWGDQEMQEKLDSVDPRSFYHESSLVDGNHREVIFEEISKAMKEGGFDKTAAQCRSKTKKLRWKYNDVLDHNQLSRRKITMPFFSELDQFLRYRPICRRRSRSRRRPRSRRRRRSPPDDSDSEDSDDNTSLDRSDLSGSENDGDQSDSESNDSQSSRSSTSSSGSSDGDNNAPQAKRGRFSSAARRRGGNGTRQKRNRMKAALESFAETLRSSYSKSMEEDMKFQLELQQLQHEHEMNMWNKILQTFASFLRQVAWHQPWGPAAPAPVQQQGAWGSASQQQPYSGRWGGASPVPPQGQVQRYSGGWGGAGPVPPQGQVKCYSGGWGSASQAPLQGQVQRYGGGWKGAGPFHSQGHMQPYGGGWGGANPVPPQGQQQPYSEGWSGASPAPPQGQMERYSGGWGGASPVPQQGQEQPFGGGWGGAGPTPIQGGQQVPAEGTCDAPSPNQGQQE